MSGTKHLKVGIGDDSAKKPKREKHGTQARDPRGIPVMVMGPSGKTKMEWRK